MTKKSISSPAWSAHPRARFVSNSSHSNRTETRGVISPGLPRKGQLAASQNVRGAVFFSQIYFKIKFALHSLADFLNHHSLLWEAPGRDIPEKFSLLDSKKCCIILVVTRRVSYRFEGTEKRKPMEALRSEMSLLDGSAKIRRLSLESSL